MMMIKMLKLTACFSVAGSHRVETDSANPRMRPPTRAPIKLPMPPRMTTIKAVNVKSWPMWGEIGISGTSSTPAAAVVAAPSAKAAL